MVIILICLLLVSLVSSSADNMNSLKYMHNISVVSWNLNERQPTPKDCRFLKDIGCQSDIVIIGVQECENIKPRINEGSRSKAWRQLQCKSLGSKFELISQHTLGGLQIALFCRRNVAKKLVGIKSFDVTCGIGNLVANKGAVGLVVHLGSLTLSLVNVHLAAHEGKAGERDSSVHRVLSQLSARSVSGWTSCNGKSAPPAATVLFGDLNYRLKTKMKKNAIEKLVHVLRSRTDGGQPASWEALLRFDELTARLRSPEAGVFSAFTEAAVAFPPTFKYDVGSDDFDSSQKARRPAWTDRILFSKSGSPLSLLPSHGAREVSSAAAVSSPLRLLDYFSVQQCRHSDHRPVVARFSITLKPNC